MMNLKTNLTPAKNMIIMAASSGNEISSTYNDKGHGLFTYFLLKGIKGEADANEDGKIEEEKVLSQEVVMKRLLCNVLLSLIFVFMSYNPALSARVPKDIPLDACIFGQI